jgi:hypothetical protein
VNNPSKRQRQLYRPLLRRDKLRLVLKLRPLDSERLCFVDGAVNLLFFASNKTAKAAIPFLTFASLSAVTLSKVSVVVVEFVEGAMVTNDERKMKSLDE